MTRLTLLCAVLAAASCSAKSDNKPEVAPAVVEGKPAKETKPDPAKEMKPEPAKPEAPADVTVTSKSPDAIAEFEKGRDLFDNQRPAEAIEHFQKAVELDADFAQAHAYLGALTPGSAGTDHLTRAVALAEKLPEAERTWIAAFQAYRAGDVGKGHDALEKVLQLAPGAWRADVALGNFTGTATNDNAATIKHFEHALSVKPDLAVAYNGLAYAHAASREWEAAITAAKKQVELLPKEPNPQDSLGEIQLWAGKYDEAEKGFQAAIALDPKFTLSWQGVALARAYRNDYKGAYEAYGKQLASTNPNDKFDPDVAMAWIALAEGKLPDALGYLDKIENDAEAKKLPIYAFAALARGNILALSGKPADAAKWYATAMTRGDALSGDGKAYVVREHALAVLRDAALAGKPAPDADKLVAAIEDQAKAAPADPTLQEDAAWARGLAAWTKTGAKDAVAELGTCNRNLVVCRYELALAQRKAGDAAAADATEKEILDTPRRDEVVVYVRSRLAKK